MKRTPVLIDVNGVPLRESLSYNGGGAGFGGQMAEWLPPAQSADAALLPALRLGNGRADGRAYVSDQLPSELALAGDAGDRSKKLCR